MQKEKRMNKGLKDICKNYAERLDCPVGTRELNKLVGNPVDDKRSDDEICKTCEKRVFEIQRLECPVCGSNGFICPKCKSSLIRNR